MKKKCRYFSQGDDDNNHADQCINGQLYHPYSCGDIKLYKTCPACKGTGYIEEESDDD